MNKIDKTLTILYIPILMLIVACSKDVVVDLDIPEASLYTNLYMPQSVNGPISRGISITDQDYELLYSAHLGGTTAAKSDIAVDFAIAPELVTSYNETNGTSYLIMPAGSYSVQSPSGTIPKGQQSTGALKLSVKTKGYLNPFETYLLPLRMKSEGDVKVNGAMATTYFLITGAYAPGEVPREKVLSLGANAGSFIIDFNGDLMYKEPTSGDLRFFKVNATTGLFDAQGRTISQGWNVFDKIVFFGPNRLIGRFRTGGQNINQYVINPDGNFLGQREVGQGWGVLAEIIPFKGLLLGIGTDGSMTQYPLNIAGDFDYGNIRQIGSGWTGLKQVFQYQNSLITIENNGDMWQYPLSDAGLFGTRSKIGTGWDMYEKVVIAGTDLLAIDKAGDVWRYKFNPMGLWPLKK